MMTTAHPTYIRLTQSLLLSLKPRYQYQAILFNKSLWHSLKTRHLAKSFKSQLFYIIESACVALSSTQDHVFVVSLLGANKKRVLYQLKARNKGSHNKRQLYIDTLPYQADVVNLLDNIDFQRFEDYLTLNELTKIKYYYRQQPYFYLKRLCTLVKHDFELLR